MMNYELWNTETRNIIAAFATEAEALVLVQEAIDEHGASYVDTLALILDNGDEVNTLAIGTGVATRARTILTEASHGASRS